MNISSRKHQSTRWVISITIFAILLMNFLSSVVILNPSHYQGGGNWLTGEKVLICTSEGLKWISVDSLKQQNSALSQHDSQGEHGDIKFHCPLLKHHQSIGTFPTEALFFLLALLSLHQKFRLNNRKSFSQRIYFMYAPKHSPPCLSSCN
ncbi:DUF2946 family protein [Photobacterium sp. OFAV2-7]|uniref:DUF2946 family protein n=1 Tax=Photobacterium sp. OFAV2-7 TaxID=2917748 RepID=UPI00351CCDA8